MLNNVTFIIMEIQHVSTDALLKALIQGTSSAASSSMYRHMLAGTRLPDGAHLFWLTAVDAGLATCLNMLFRLLESGLMDDMLPMNWLKKLLSAYAQHGHKHPYDFVELLYMNFIKLTHFGNQLAHFNNNTNLYLLLKSEIPVYALLLISFGHCWCPLLSLLNPSDL